MCMALVYVTCILTISLLLGLKLIAWGITLINAYILHNHSVIVVHDRAGALRKGQELIQEE